MTGIIVRYRTRPQDADANQQLVEAVFAELAAAETDGIAYAAYRLDDNSFVHVARIEASQNPLESIEAFGAFTAYLPDRCEPGHGPDPQPATLVGNHRLLE